MRRGFQRTDPEDANVGYRSAVHGLVWRAQFQCSLRRAVERHFLEAEAVKARQNPQIRFRQLRSRSESRAPAPRNRLGHE